MTTTKKVIVLEPKDCGDSCKIVREMLKEETEVEYLSMSSPDGERLKELLFDGSKQSFDLTKPKVIVVTDAEERVEKEEGTSGTDRDDGGGEKKSDDEKYGEVVEELGGEEDIESDDDSDCPECKEDVGTMMVIGVCDDIKKETPDAPVDCERLAEDFRKGSATSNEVINEVKKVATGWQTEHLNDVLELMQTNGTEKGGDDSTRDTG